MNYSAYCDAIREQVDIHQQLLDELKQQGLWHLLQRTAAERSIQILCEAAIGAAKHCNKKLHLPNRTDSYTPMAQLLEKHPCEGVNPLQLKGAVGMRNAIVHDYLNLDWQLIQKVIEDGHYKTLSRFTEHCCQLLEH